MVLGTLKILPDVQHSKVINLMQIKYSKSLNNFEHYIDNTSWILNRMMDLLLNLKWVQ